MLSRAARPSGAIAAAMLLAVVATDVASAQSPPGSAGAKAAAKCQQTIAKVNAKFLSQRVKRLATCSNGVLACLQTQPGAAACVTKAAAKCTQQLGTVDVADLAAEKLEAAVVKACGSLPIVDLLATGGLGFSDSAAACAAVGVAPIASAEDVARCLQRLHSSLSEQAYGIELPRAAELTAQAGVSAFLVPDLPPFDGCGDCGTPPIVTGKVITGCGATIAKAGSAFLAKARAGLDKCASAFVGCAQLKPGDVGCLAKAKATCQKLPTDLAKARSSLLAALTKKCGATLAFSTLGAQSGINLGALACDCQEVGVAPVSTLGDYALCLTRRHECDLAALLPTLTPSLDGLLAGQSLNVSDLLCEPPVATAAFADSQPRARIGVFGGISKFMKKVFPGSLKASGSPFATRGTARRVGRPSFGGCFAAPGRSCTFRFPITKKPASLQKARGTVAPPALVVGVQRADGTFADQHFEVDLGDTSVDQEVEVEITYADDLASCDFELALAVAEEGQVSGYTTVEQTPHAIPGNDVCNAARILTNDDLTEVLDVTAATELGEPTAPCAPGGISRTVWYRFTPTANGTLTVDTSGSDFDSSVAVWTGACSDLFFQTCANDDAGSQQAKLTTPVVAGTTYFIQVGVNGAPPLDTSTLHFAFAFARVGSPPIAQSLKPALEELNSNICPNHGSLFRLSFKYADADGDVPFANGTANVEAVFTPSAAVSRFTTPLEIDGDGFSGTATFLVCTFYSLDTNVTTRVRLIDSVGAGPPVSADIARPSGAN